MSARGNHRPPWALVFGRHWSQTVFVSCLMSTPMMIDLGLIVRPAGRWTRRCCNGLIYWRRVRRANCLFVCLFPTSFRRPASISNLTQPLWPTVRPANSPVPFIGAARDAAAANEWVPGHREQPPDVLADALQVAARKRKQAAVWHLWI